MRAYYGFLLGGLLLALAVPTQAASARILKVLPHLLDQKGRHTLSPSLFERDAYQSNLRSNRDMVSALRFDVQWKRGSKSEGKFRMRIETRGGAAGSEPLTVEEEVKFKGLFTAWSSLSLTREQYLALGGVSAWRVTLWRDDEQIDEVKSFLW